MLLDLDNFKQVNDVNGHTAGDRVLQSAAERLSDALPADAVLARLGGDEFACAVPFPANELDRIEHLASLLIENVAKPISLGEQAIEITVSVGIANSEDCQRDAVSLDNPEFAQSALHKADIAMYHAKKQGKNRFFWFEREMEHELRFRNDLENGIRKGILTGEFVPFYEQQVDVDTGALVGFEMLARWNSPDLGLVGPDVFIPVAEDIGVIAELSQNLIAEALEDAKAWHEDLSLSVNISPVQMRDPWFAQKLVKLMLEHNFPPSRLEIEITESCLHENVDTVRSMITSLRNQGVRVSLDDFGTGYASLAQLRTLPFDRLKIDRSFIQQLEGEETSEKLVDAIISMGDGLDIPITAEGIETPEILNALKKMGKLKGQGYHYGKPEPASGVRKRLEERELLSSPSGKEDHAEPVPERKAQH
jgi:diguanylate cyclase (GGDEF)-like protein